MPGKYYSQSHILDEPRFNFLLPVYRDWDRGVVGYRFGFRVDHELDRRACHHGKWLVLACVKRAVFVVVDQESLQLPLVGSGGREGQRCWHGWWELALWAVAHVGGAHGLSGLSRTIRGLQRRTGVDVSNGGERSGDHGKLFASLAAEEQLICAVCHIRYLARLEQVAWLASPRETQDDHPEDADPLLSGGMHFHRDGYEVFAM